MQDTDLLLSEFDYEIVLRAISKNRKKRIAIS